jgi:hypothetical protein
VKDWPLLEEAVDAKLEDQDEFVQWWDSPEGVRGKGERANVPERGHFAADAEARTGITKQQYRAGGQAWRRPSNTGSGKSRPRSARPASSRSNPSAAAECGLATNRTYRYVLFACASISSRANLATMAVSSQVIERFAEASGRNPFTLVRMLSTLRAAKLVPKGGPGGGKSSAHFSVEHLANVVLGLAGLEPSDAVEAAESLARLQALKFTPTPGDQRQQMMAARLSGPVDDNWKFPFKTLGGFVEHLIALYVTIGREGLVEPIARIEAEGLPWSLELCLNPLSARELRGDVVQKVFAADEPAPLAGLEVVTRLRLPVILTAAGLALDTERHEAAVVQVSRPGQSAGNENAVPGRTAPRPPRPKTRTADPHDRPHSLMRKEREQSVTCVVPSPRGFAPPIEGPAPCP